MKPGVFLTFDVECGMGGAWQDPDARPVPPARGIMGQFGRRRMGLPLIAEILDDNGLAATFFVDPFNDELVSRRRDKRNGGAKSCGAILDTVEYREQLVDICFVRCVLTGIPGSRHTRSAAECIDFETRVVGNRRMSGCGDHRSRLQQGVTRKRVLRLVHIGPRMAGNHDDGRVEPGKDRFDLGDLVGVLGGNDDTMGTPHIRHSFCIATSSAIPPAA